MKEDKIIKIIRLAFAIIIISIIAYLYSNRFIVLDNGHTSYIINKYTKKCYYIAAPDEKGVIEFYLKHKDRESKK